MADEFTLNVELRTDLGKGASRRLRRLAELVPAVLYGAGKDPVSLSIASKDIHKSTENEAFFAHIINLSVAGSAEPAIVKALQRHPASGRIMHADFLRVKMDQAIQVDIPLHFINEENCVGVKQDGGMVSHIMSALHVSCLPGDLPEFIEIDVESLVIGSSLHMSDVVLPKGVTIPELELGADHDQVVVSVTVTRAIVEDEVGEAAADEATDGEAGDEPAED